MPNTPALVGEGATGVYATHQVSEEQKKDAFKVLSSISKAIYWVDKESLIDVVTGVSGSGPAYFFLIVEALEAAGIALGLPLEVARGLASQTCMGAGKMLVNSEDSPAELRRKVTSPKGTTEAAVASLEADRLREVIARAVQTGAARGEELGRLLGAQVLSRLILVDFKFKIITSNKIIYLAFQYMPPSLPFDKQLRFERDLLFRKFPFQQ